MFKQIMFIVIVGVTISSAFPTETNSDKADQLIPVEKRNSPSMDRASEDLESPDDAQKQDGQTEKTEVVGSDGSDLKGSETFAFGYYPRYYVGWGGYHRYGYGWGWRRPIYYW